MPPGYRRSKPPVRPKLDPFLPIIDQILEDDRSQLKKQRHTARRIFERLRDEHGFTGKLTIITDYLREKKRRAREVFVPLAHPPGHAQVDFGEALGEIGGVVRKIRYVVMVDIGSAIGPSDNVGAALGRLLPPRRRKPSATGMSRRSPSLAACRCRSSTTIQPLPLRRSSATGPASGPGSSRSCSRTTCSRIGSAAWARGMTKAP